MSSQLHGNPMHPAVTSSPSADPAAAPAIVKRAQAAGASGLLVALHTGSNTGYAIAPLERAFLRMAREVVGSDDRIHFAYPNLDRGRPDTLPPGFSNIASLDLRSSSPPDLEALERYVRTHRIETVFAFDAPVSLPSYKPMRRAGVRSMISYWGAPMSSLNRGFKLLAKRLETRLRFRRPDHFIFESESMRETAVRGRGIPYADTSVVYLGVDPDRFYRRGDRYAHETFGIPYDRRVVVYSGHMETRKGVHILVESFVRLAERDELSRLHLLILGNQPGQEEQFRDIYVGTRAEDHITFGGYRSDIAEIFGSADIGAIASTGWDSFTMSAAEMAASELPLVVSRLQGLKETVDDGVTGYLFEPGNASDLANHLVALAAREDVRRQLGAAARRRALQRHSQDRQVADLAAVVKAVAAPGR